DGDRCTIRKYDDIFGHRDTKTQRRQRHKDTEKKHGAPDAAPRSGGRGVPTANERPVDRGSVVRLRFARLTARPAVQADRVERLLCVSVSQWLVQINTSP